MQNHDINTIPGMSPEQARTAQMAIKTVREANSLAGQYISATDMLWNNDPTDHGDLENMIADVRILRAQMREQLVTLGMLPALPADAAPTTSDIGSRVAVHVVNAIAEMLGIKMGAGITYRSGALIIESVKALTVLAGNSRAKADTMHARFAAIAEQLGCDPTPTSIAAHIDALKAASAEFAASHDDGTVVSTRVHNGETFVQLTAPPGCPALDLPPHILVGIAPGAGPGCDAPDLPPLVTVDTDTCTATGTTTDSASAVGE